MLLRVFRAQFIALSEFGKLRKSLTGFEPYLNHGICNYLNIKKLQKVHRKIAETRSNSLKLAET